MSVNINSSIKMHSSKQKLLSILVVEFVGLQASGKSTLCRLVYQGLCAYGLPVQIRSHTPKTVIKSESRCSSHYVRVFQPYIRIVPALIRNIDVAWLLLKTVVRERRWLKQSNWKSQVLYQIFTVDRRRMQLRQSVSASSIQLHEEGIFHNYIEIGWSVPNISVGDVVQNAMGLIQTSHVLVVVHVDSDELLRRMSIRENNGPIGREILDNPARISERMHIFKTVRNAAAKLAELRDEIEVIEIDNNSRSPEETANEVVNQIRASWERLTRTHAN